jgi:hypothetical protein
MLHVAFVFAGYRALLDGLLYFADAIFLIRHGCSPFTWAIDPHYGVLGPSSVVRKNDADARRLDFQKFLIRRAREPYAKFRQPPDRIGAPHA